MEQPSLCSNMSNRCEKRVVDEEFDRSETSESEQKSYPLHSRGHINMPKRAEINTSCFHISSAAKPLIIAYLCSLAALYMTSTIGQVEAASARVNMHQVSRQTNQCKFLFQQFRKTSAQTESVS